MFTNLKLPIVILSSPRSGSNVLYDTICNYLSDNKIHYVGTGVEPLLFDNYNDTKSLKKFDEIIATNNFVTKIHAIHLKKLYPNYFVQNILQKKYTIVRIRRRNIIEQLISLYICTLIDIINKGDELIWSNTKKSNRLIEDKKIPIYEDVLKKVINYGILAITYCENFNYNFDLDLYYEDLSFNSKKHFKPTKKPSNYEELHTIFSDHLAKIDFKQNNDILNTLL